MNFASWRLRFTSAAFAILLSCNSLFGAEAERTKNLVDVPYFESDVRPIFKAMCFHCHGEEEDLSGGLDVRLVRLMQHGGDSGPAISNHNPDESLLWERIESDEMPEGPKKLNAADKNTIRRWIAAGSPTLRPEPADVNEAKYTPEELGFWSFQPVADVEVPLISDGIVKTPIDAFVLEKLRQIKLDQSPTVERNMLLRRVTFDLTGLPPTPQELDEFLADNLPKAYEKVVDRLLASEQFGVRWGRHWLDIAGYSETDGYLADDIHRPYAWRYRDYVIDSINIDKPYDQFLQEQIAGDEIIGDLTHGSPPDPDNDRHVELITATGFLQMAPDLTQRQEAINDRNQAVAETIKVVSSAVLGLTVGCAQCHDHRYDPISAEDYYSLRAIFDPAFPLDSWTKPENRVLDLTPQDIAREIERIDAIAKEQEAELAKKKRELATEIYARLISELPDDRREAIIAAAEKEHDQRDDSEKKLLEQFPMFKSIEGILGQISTYDKVKFEEFFQAQKKIDELRESGPTPRIVACIRESDKSLPKSAVFSRGDPLSPKSPVQPREVFVLARKRNAEKIPINREVLSTTGRRLAYAMQLTDGTHPTVARVAVNRIWSHHFGKGLVTTTSDFGLSGEEPSHPRLLDWLASDFVEHGWYMKRLHKMIVMSHTYQQSSLRSDSSEKVDPSNRWLSRMSMRRLDAEEVRDAILSVTGLLNLEMGGPSVPIATQSDGHVVIGRAIFNNDGLLEDIVDVGNQKNRRSIYLSNERISPLTMLDTFDAPIMSPNCDGRLCSTVAPQSLWFLNDKLITEVTDQVADRMFESEFIDSNDRIRELFRRFYAAEPTADEMRKCLLYLKIQSAEFRKYDEAAWVETVKKFDHAPDIAAYASLCQTLLSTNRFLYVE